LFEIVRKPVRIEFLLVSFVVFRIPSTEVPKVTHQTDPMGMIECGTLQMETRTDLIVRTRKVLEKEIIKVKAPICRKSGTRREIVETINPPGTNIQVTNLLIISYSK